MLSIFGVSIVLYLKNANGGEETEFLELLVGIKFVFIQ